MNAPRPTSDSAPSDSASARARLLASYGLLGAPSEERFRRLDDLLADPRVLEIARTLSGRSAPGPK